MTRGDKCAADRAPASKSIKERASGGTWVSADGIYALAPTIHFAGKSRFLTTGECGLPSGGWTTGAALPSIKLLRPRKQSAKTAGAQRGDATFGARMNSAIVIGALAVAALLEARKPTILVSSRHQS